MAEQTGDLISLVRKGDHDAIAAALAAGADPDSSDRWGVSALAYAAGRGDVTVIDRLLAAGASVNLSSRAGNTPLMLAAARGQLEAVKLLLQRGADRETVNKWGLGAADWATWPPESRDILALLRA